MKKQTTQTTIEQATAWLHTNSQLLNLNEIAKRIKVDGATFHRAVYGKKDSMQRTIKIPKRCLPELIKIMEELNIFHLQNMPKTHPSNCSCIWCDGLSGVNLGFDILRE